MVPAALVLFAALGWRFEWILTFTLISTWCSFSIWSEVPETVCGYVHQNIINSYDNKFSIQENILMRYEYYHSLKLLRFRLSTAKIMLATSNNNFLNVPNVTTLTVTTLIMTDDSGSYKRLRICGLFKEWKEYIAVNTCMPR